MGNKIHFAWKMIPCTAKKKRTCRISDQKHSKKCKSISCHLDFYLLPVALFESCIFNKWRFGSTLVGIKVSLPWRAISGDSMLPGKWAAVSPGECQKVFSLNTSNESAWILSTRGHDSFLHLPQTSSYLMQSFLCPKLWISLKVLFGPRGVGAKWSGNSLATIFNQRCSHRESSCRGGSNQFHLLRVTFESLTYPPGSVEPLRQHLISSLGLIQEQQDPFPGDRQMQSAAVRKQPSRNYASVKVCASLLVFLQQPWKKSIKMLN